MNTNVDFSIIIESYNLSEGTSHERFRLVLQTASAMAQKEGKGEVLVADAYGSPALEKMLCEEFPGIKHAIATGHCYDDAKAMAAQSAAGRYVLFLDGDCVPDTGWQKHLLESLQSGKEACGGYTRYEGGFLASIMSVMDFGFFYPRKERNLKCYASNNCGFHKETLQNIPVPEGDLRCCCYYHAQRLWRRGTPVWLVPQARVLHELPPIIRERTRQGHDLIAACRADPELPEARWVRLGVMSVPLFYAMSVWLDWKRIFSGYKDLDLSPRRLLLSLLFFPAFRLIDVMGMIRAFLFKSGKEGWGGYGA